MEAYRNTPFPGVLPECLVYLALCMLLCSSSISIGSVVRMQKGKEKRIVGRNDNQT